MSLGLSVISSVAVLRDEIGQLKGDTKTVALVPTMGALHEGHLSLIDFAKQKCDIVVVSIFVNPTQFGENEDFGSYPRTLETDIRALESVKADIVFCPEVEDVYPQGFQTTVTVKDISQGLCGRSRPDHFAGVATVVTKLLLMVCPDVAVFGEKDYQQLLVIKQAVKDLNIPVKILGAPILRAEDGLALSSRNQYLSDVERALAPRLQETLSATSHLLLKGQTIDKSLNSGIATLTEAGFEVDYLELRDPLTLLPMDGTLSGRSGRLLVAAKLGKTRLIDNIAVTALSD